MGDTIDIQRAFRFAPGRLLVLRADPAFTVVAGSEEFLKATADASIIGRSFFDVLRGNGLVDGPQAVHRMRASLASVVSTGLPDATGVDVPILAEDGTVEYVVHRFDCESHGAARGAIGILESIAEGFFALDEEWRFGYVNQQAHRILGRENGTLRGRALWNEYPGLEGTEFEACYRRSMHERATTTFTAYYAGHERWYEVSSYPAPEGISVYFRDVTRQKLMEAERERLVDEGERQRRIYETALDSTPDFVYVFDLEHRAIYANAALLRTWGVGAVHGKRWMDLGYEQWHADLHDRELDQVIATKAPIRGEIPFTGTNGRRMYDYIFAPVLAADGEVVAVAGTTRDVTDRVDMVARMLENQRLESIGILAGGVAHDFNNMLAAILGNVALAKEESDPESPVVERLELVHRAAERARSLVRQILTFSRNGPKLEAVQPLQPMVDEAIALMRATLPAGVRLVVRLAPAALCARVDAARFQQLVVNLCTNAWQALHDVGGEICVSLELVPLTAQQATPLELQPGDHACLTVTDNGRGMDETILNRIFEPFFTTKPVGQGTGLGLAVVHSVVKESGGHVQVESKPGRGTRITILLPLALEPLIEHVSDRGDTSESRGHSGARVLYVDDDEVVSLTASALLVRGGFAVTTVESGAAAMAALTDAPAGFAAVVTDFNMPGMSGLAVAEVVQRDAPETPVIIVSGYVTDELRLAARRLGVTEVLAKEEILEQLTHAVHRVLKRPGS